MIGANQCPHGALRRSCEICALTAERDHLRKINARLLAALAWASDQIEDSLDPDHQAALAGIQTLLTTDKE